MGADLRKPWHDSAPCPKGCGAIACLSPYNPSGWYGPQDATLFCPACGAGWRGTDEEIERALISETWWDACNESGLSEEAFVWATAADAEPCTKMCFRRGCQHPERHFGKPAVLCSLWPDCTCGRCRYLTASRELGHPDLAAQAGGTNGR